MYLTIYFSLSPAPAPLQLKVCLTPQLVTSSSSEGVLIVRERAGRGPVHLSCPGPTQQPALAAARDIVASGVGSVVTLLRLHSRHWDTGPLGSRHSTRPKHLESLHFTSQSFKKMITDILYW